MVLIFNCDSVKSLNESIRQIRKDFFSEILEVYNLGDHKFAEYPLFIVQSNGVARLHFNEGDLSLSVYDKETFWNNVSENMFNNPVYKGSFDYIYPEKRTISASIVGVVPVRGAGTKKNLEGIDIVLSDGRRIYIRPSEWVLGTMDSWIE